MHLSCCDTMPTFPERYRVNRPGLSGLGTNPGDVSTTLIPGQICTYARNDDGYEWDCTVGPYADTSTWTFNDAVQYVYANGAPPSFLGQGYHYHAEEDYWDVPLGGRDPSTGWPGYDPRMGPGLMNYRGPMDGSWLTYATRLGLPLNYDEASDAMKADYFAWRKTTFPSDNLGVILGGTLDLFQNFVVPAAMVYGVVTGAATLTNLFTGGANVIAPGVGSDTIGSQAFADDAFASPLGTSAADAGGGAALDATTGAASSGEYLMPAAEPVQTFVAQVYQQPLMTLPDGAISAIDQIIDAVQSSGSTTLPSNAVNAIDRIVQSVYSGVGQIAPLLPAGTFSASTLSALGAAASAARAIYNAVTGQSSIPINPATGRPYTTAYGAINPATGQPYTAINPATGQPYTAINPATGLPYTAINPATGLPYASSQQNIMPLALLGMGALFLLSGKTKGKSK